MSTSAHHSSTVALPNIQVAGLHPKSTVPQVWETGDYECSKVVLFLQSLREICTLRHHPSVRCGGWATFIIVLLLTLISSTNSPKPLWSGGNKTLPDDYTLSLNTKPIVFILHYSVPNYKPYLTGSLGWLYSFSNLMVKGSVFKYNVFQKDYLKSIVLFKSSASFNAIFRLVFSN